MNSDSALLQRQLVKEVTARGGLEEFRKHALKHHKLKTVVKVGAAILSQVHMWATSQSTRKRIACFLTSAMHVPCMQESHCSQIHQLCFNFTDDQCDNLFATVGKDQVRNLAAECEQFLLAAHP